MQRTSKCTLCGDRDEKVCHIISKYSNLAQKKCKYRDNYVGKVIRSELC